MPYILKEDRGWIDGIVSRFLVEIKHRGMTGNLNYFLFKLAKWTCKSYSDYQQFIGELECAKLEIYRRLASPYEDKKIEINGDVE
jgi:hypothetical protein